MRILIIGGTKFLGPQLVRRLAGSGHDVAVFHRGQTHADLPPGVMELLGDRAHFIEHAREFRGLAPEIVVDMIAMFPEHASALVETFRGIARRVVVASSGDVYRAYGVLRASEPGPVERVPLTEESPLRQSLFPYRGIAGVPEDLAQHYEKILVERIIQRERALPATVLRLPMVYGPGDEDHRLFPYLRQMEAGRSAIVLDEGMAEWRCPRGFVDDVADAIALAVEKERASGRIYNVAEADALTEAEWVRQIAAVVGWDGEIVVAPKGRLSVRINTDQQLVYDTRRIRAELGYQERTPRSEALQRTVEWERANPPPQPWPDLAAENEFLAESRSDRMTRT